MRDKGQECRTDPSSQYNGVRKVHFSLSWRGRGEPASSPPQVAGEGAEEAPGPLRKEGGRLAWPASGAHRRGKGGKRGVRSGRLSGLRLPLARPSTLPLRPLSPSQGVLQSTPPPPEPVSSTGEKTETSRWAEVAASGLSPATGGKAHGVKQTWATSAGQSGRGRVEVSFPSFSSPLHPSTLEGEEPEAWGAWKGHSGQGGPHTHTVSQKSIYLCDVR